MNNELDKLAINAICDTPLWFSIKEYRKSSLSVTGKRTTCKRFCIHTISLGKFLRIQQLASEIGINILNLEKHENLLELAQQSGPDISNIIAITTLHGKEEVSDYQKMQSRAKLFAKHLEVNEMVDLLFAISAMIAVTDFQDYFGITSEIERRREVEKSKTDKKNYTTYGGNSIWGSVIGAVIKETHWTYDYIVWGISYQNLSMILADMLSCDYDSEVVKEGHSQIGKDHKFSDPASFFAFTKQLKS